VQRLIDRRGEDLDADRQADQRRCFEGFNRAHEENEEGGGSRGQGEAKRDAPRDLEDRSSAHERRFLQGRVHGAQGGAHQEKGEGGMLDAVHPHHPPKGVDVEKDGVGVEQALQNEIDDTDLRTREHDPGGHEQDAGNDDRHHAHGVEQFLPRRVGALTDPGEKGADPECEQRGAQRIAR
jgi:hypothetical protein